VPVSNGGNIASGDGGLSNGIAYPFNLKDKSKLANMQNDKCYIGVALST
jgi:hypothetical protein